MRRPWPAVVGWTTAVATATTPWLLAPPLWVRLVASVLAGLTAWGAARAVGGAVAGVRNVLRGRARSPRLAVGLAAVLVLAGCAAPSSAPPDEASARAAVAELAHSGGLARSTILIAIPTGSGWVDEGAVASLSRLTGGDLAVVSVPYAHHPSWVEFLLGTDRATRSATAVLRAVRSAVDALPAGRPPRVLIFGESLGATAAAAAVQEVGGVDGCLLVGRPGSAGGDPVPGCTDVRNDDDPIPWWRPGLLVSPRAGLPWLPGVTFWQMTGGLVTSLDQPLGHGHRYGETLAGDWTRLLADHAERADQASQHRPPGVARTIGTFASRPVPTCEDSRFGCPLEQPGMGDGPWPFGTSGTRRRRSLPG